MRTPIRIILSLGFIILLLLPSGFALAGRSGLPNPFHKHSSKKKHPSANQPATPPPAQETPSGPPAAVNFAVSLERPTNMSASAVLRTSVVAYQHEAVLDFMWEKLLKEQRVGTVLIEPKWEIILPSTSLQDMKQRMTRLDKVVTDIVRAGGSVLLTFQCVPRWISSQPGNNALLLANQNEKIWYSVPPKNYDDWSGVVQAFVQHFNKELPTNGHVAYMIGSEPENYWKGTEQEFFKYYQYAVKGALAADPAARIGGITPANHQHNTFNTTGTATEGGRPLLQNWIRFCRANSLPIHFVTWHSFSAGSPLPIRSTQWNRAKEDITAWLGESGYRDSELILTDWPEWKPHPENDTEMKSAWATTGMISLLTDGLTRVTYLALRDAARDKQAAARQASFGGGNGLFTQVGIIKPVYNAFRLMSQMGGKIVLVDTQDDFVTAIASTDGDRKVWILLSSFVPPDWLIPRNLFRPETQVLGEDARLSPQEKKQIQDLSIQAVTGQLDLSNVKLDPQVKTWLTDIQAFSAKARARRGRQVQLSLQIQGAQPGAWNVEEYIVDGQHANTFAHLDEIVAKVNPMIAGGKKPDPNAVRSLVESINAGADVLTAKGGGRLDGSSPPVFTTTLAPNAVHLVVLSR